MERYDKTLDQLMNSSGELKSNMHMLNEIVPVEEQMKYFQYSKYIQTNKEKDSLDRNYLIARLFTPEVEIEDRRYYLSILAGITDVAAYRALEAYHKNPLEAELAYWSALALTESKILLDAELSGEKQFFLSTGLGGKDKKLRYFSVITTTDRSDFTDFQKEALLSELQFRFEQDEIDLEEIQVEGKFVKILILCGLSHDARISIEKVVDEVNLLGGFIDHRFLLTNVKQIGDEEIEKLLKKKK